MGFRKFASTALDWGKDLPNKAINKGMGYVDSSAILDKVQDTTAYAQNRLLERSITNGENSASRLKSPLHRGARGVQQFTKNLTANDVSSVARNAIGSAAAGAITGAAGGMASEDQSVLGGAIWGAGLGALGGAGAGMYKMSKTSGVNSRIDKLTKKLGDNRSGAEGRIRDLRANRPAAKGSQEAFQADQARNAGLGVRGATGTRGSRINADIRSGRFKSFDEEAKLNSRVNRTSKRMQSLSSKRLDNNLSSNQMWGIGAMAGAATLAHSTLTSNTALPY